MNESVPNAPLSSPEGEELTAKRTELRRLDEEPLYREMRLEMLRARVDAFADTKPGFLAAHSCALPTLGK